MSIENTDPDHDIRELMSDAMAFRALADIPSLWKLSLVFGPRIELNIAWGSGRGIEAIAEGHIVATDRRSALRKVILEAQEKIFVGNA